MIAGIGIDIVEVSRIEHSVEKWGDRFLRKVFTPGEVAYAEQKSFPPQHLAARFAAKEAVLKAFGEDYSMRSVAWNEIEVLSEKSGKPTVQLWGRMKKIQEQRCISDIIVSLSHTSKYAVASVIMLYAST